jgi:hypothetical protein
MERLVVFAVCRLPSGTPNRLRRPYTAIMLRPVRRAASCAGSVLTSSSSSAVHTTVLGTSVPRRLCASLIFRLAASV